MKIIIPIAKTALALIGIFMLFHYFLTESFTPKSTIETLENPQQVLKITPQGLVLENGSTLKIKYISEIPIDSKILKDAVSKGIEIDKEGNLSGLLKIHHWCGNDPVRYHLAKVQLSSLMLADGATPNSKFSKIFTNIHFPSDRQLRYSNHGLNISDLAAIYRITNYLKEINPPADSAENN